MLEKPLSVSFSKIGHIEYPVEDLDRAIDFYTKKLGLELIGRYEDVWAGLRAGDLEIWLICDEEIAAGGSTTAVFHVDDFDRAYELLKKRGVEFEGEVEEHPGGKEVWFFDSEGNSLGIYKPVLMKE